jgi:hypothetical protein
MNIPDCLRRRLSCEGSKEGSFGGYRRVFPPDTEPFKEKKGIG